MKFIVRILALVFLFPFSTSAQSFGHVIEEFDVEAGYFEEIEISTQSRLNDTGSIQGYIQVDKCNFHEEWDAGTRFAFQTQDKNTSHYFGIICKRDSDQIRIEWAHWAGGDDGEFIESEIVQTSLITGDKVLFDITYQNNVVIFIADKAKFRKEILITEPNILFFAFGTTGKIVIYDNVT